MTLPAIEKRRNFLPYCLPLIGDEEIAEVADSLRSGWVTTGPKARKFEQAFAEHFGIRHAIALNSCTAGLLISLAARNIDAGDEVIVPTMTFCSTANVVIHLGATPVVVDTDDNLLLTADIFRKAITPRTKAVMPVHYSGYPCDMDGIREVAAHHGIHVIEDAAHAVGSMYKGNPIGFDSPAAVFSFSATKNLCTGEGGMLVTNEDQFAERCRLLSHHGISRDTWKRFTQADSWRYEVLEAGYKANMTDIQASIGIHQLARLESFNRRRTEIADLYDHNLTGVAGLKLPRRPPDGVHSFYAYPIQVIAEKARMSRDALIEELRACNIGTSVHFIPLHRHPLYTGGKFSLSPSAFPASDGIFRGLMSLPLYPKMTDEDAMDVVNAVRHFLA